MQIGIDTGGTFTDFVFVAGRTIHVAKVPSTRDDPSRAILAGLAASAEDTRAAAIVHGSTVATNALLERRLARVAFVTNAGLEDVLELGRQARKDLYAFDVEVTPPLVPRALRYGVGERADARGRTIRTASRAELARLVARLRRARPEAIAIGLLHSYLDAGPERRIERALAPLARAGVPIVRSAEVAPEVREFERFSSAVANAALAPVVARYLDRLARALPGRKLYVFQSNGGRALARSAARHPVRLVLSGPAGGAIAAARVARRARLAAALTIDIGGTSSDLAFLRGSPERRGEITFAGLPLLVPSLDIQSIGAGGGSLAWIDKAGLLRVGPQSAGADPGPACYGRSGEATVTDAHLALGRLPLQLAGGEVALSRERAEAALGRLGERLRLDVRRTAEGVLTLADAVMARAARQLAVARGVDPRGLPLIAFGGAGPLHAARLVRRLPCAEALIPLLPGNLSALGMALADPERDLARTIAVLDPDSARAAVGRALSELEREGTRELRADGLLRRGQRPAVSASLECRYAGQTATLPVAPGPGVRARFDAAHRAAFGHAFPDRAVEAVNARVRLVVASGAEQPPAAREPRGRALPGRLVGAVRRAWFGGRWIDTPIVRRDVLEPGHRLRGPAIVEEFGATTVVEPGFQLQVDRERNLRLRPRRGAAV